MMHLQTNIIHAIVYETCTCARARVRAPLDTYLNGRFPQHTATHRNALQYTATDCHALQHTATHCNTPHPTTRHCNTQQHMETRCMSPAAFLIFQSECTSPFCKQSACGKQKPHREKQKTVMFVWCKAGSHLSSNLRCIVA